MNKETDLSSLIPVEKEQMVEIIKQAYNWNLGELTQMKWGHSPEWIIRERGAIVEYIKQLAVQLGVNYEVKDE